MSHLSLWSEAPGEARYGECDIVLSADGYMVLFHNATMARFGYPAEKVEALPLGELQRQLLVGDPGEAGAFAQENAQAPRFGSECACVCLFSRSAPSEARR